MQSTIPKRYYATQPNTFHTMQSTVPRHYQEIRPKTEPALSVSSTASEYAPSRRVPGRQTLRPSKYAKYDRILGSSRNLTMKKKKNRVESFERSAIHSMRDLKRALHAHASAHSLDFHIRATIPFSAFDLPHHPQPAQVDVLYNHIRREIYAACGIALVLNHTDRAKDNVTRSKRYICRQDARGDCSKRGTVSSLKRYDCGSRFIFKYKDRYAFVELDLLHKATHPVDTTAEMPLHMQKDGGAFASTTPEQRKMDISRFLVGPVDESPLQSDSDDCAETDSVVPVARKRNAANFTYASGCADKKRRTSSISEDGVQLPRIKGVGASSEHVPVMLPSLEIAGAAEQIPRLEPLPSQNVVCPPSYNVSLGSSKLSPPLYNRSCALEDLLVTFTPPTSASSSISQLWAEQQQQQQQQRGHSLQRVEEGTVYLPPLMQRSASLDQSQALPLGAYAPLSRSSSLDHGYGYGHTYGTLQPGQWNSVWAGPAYPHAQAHAQMYGVPVQGRPVLVYGSPYATPFSSRHNSFSRGNAM